MTKIIELNADLINAIDLSEQKKYIEWNKKNIEYFDLPAGKEHYKLLSYISTCLDSSNAPPLIDIGTYFGFSASALSYNNSKVISYDVCDWIPDNEFSIKNNDNIETKIMNCVNDMDIIKDAAFIILDIDPHNGEEERVIIKALIDNGFKGFLLLDDIKLNKDMQDFWDEITLPKVDVTSVGHWSGTGIVLFSDMYDIVVT